MGFRVSKRQECKLGKLCSSPHRQGNCSAIFCCSDTINGGERLQVWLHRDTGLSLRVPNAMDWTAAWMPALERGIRAHEVEVTAFSAIFVGMGMASQHRPVTGLIFGRRQGLI